MSRITFTADEQHEAILEEVEDEDDVDSQAGAVRTCIERADALQQDLIEREEELQQRISERDEEIADLERRVESLQNQNRTLIMDRQEKQELVAYVDGEKSYREAPIWKRAKWWVVGRGEE